MRSCLSRTHLTEDLIIYSFSPLRPVNSSASPTCEFVDGSSLSSSGANFDRESFDNVHLDLSAHPGKCKLAESGLGWRPSGGGDTFTLDSSNIGGAQWSRAAKGFELRILSRSSGVIQLDGFDQEVRFIFSRFNLVRIPF